MGTRFTQTVIVSDDALSQEVGGEMVILDLRSEQYFGLDEVGARIWQLMQENGELQQVFDRMLDEFDVQADSLETDMMALLGELERTGLVSMDDAQVQ